MRLIQFFLILFIFVSTNVVAEEEKRSSVLSILQKLGAGFGQAEQELLPPDEAFKFSIEVKDEHTLIANLIPAKDYYLYRDKIAFEPKSDGIHIEKIILPPGKMKEDQTFGKTEVYYQPVQAVISLKREVPAVNQLSLAATYQGCNEPIGVCYAPIKKENDITLPTIKAALNTAAETISGNAAAANVDAAAELFQTPAGLPAIETESYKIEQMFASGNFWLILTGFFGIGLLLAFTPCVFPMFPILSGIIANRSQHLTKRRGLVLALAYVLGMAIAYAIAGIAAGLSGAMLSAALQNAWVLGTFALIFVVLAFSMFGFYELQLPSFLQSKLSEEAGHLRGGHLSGVFGMGALSALIVSPCVAAPLAGALLYISQTRDVVLGGASLFMMALGMGVPLLLLGASAGALLPKSGPWMESIQQFFGVLLLAVAIWLISPVISEVAHMLLWAALLIISAIYLHAIDPLPERASGFRKFLKGLGVIALLTGVALLIGVLSGSRDILQPLSKLSVASAGNNEVAQSVSLNQADHLPFQRIKTIAELDEVIQQSKNKYIMVDFYADWCISCKEMERFTFTDANVQARLKDVVLLQVDVTAGTPDDTALLKRFKLFGPPGILFLDRQGNEVPNIKIIGYLNKKDFLTVLDAVLI
ncbi:MULTISPECIES: protein-disulfide reductase DsbD [Nitrosomonas]|uniref:Thiol:disulfide interchange protein DsbD n=1 Tax=Nitrosomonas communis TaxID=44574 RepID=A0A0F7KG09_9PROT|nr:MULTISPECIES: protein-disulfide reductase DsbD [Nitrosomonas]AKH37792.1 thiol:disulfide interchange protein [Nitrosomonas communis]TYP84880.1 thiol:disulfide interchange protein DsbD [Nitrosomonas communis]UVS63135.1 protein-disulfide reductase DsbD [Nitrosomonas sp. PLL12]